MLGVKFFLVTLHPEYSYCEQKHGLMGQNVFDEQN